MIVLHAALTENDLVVWGEQSTNESERPAKVTNRRSEGAPPLRYPYDAGPGPLLAAINEAPLGFNPKRRDLADFVAWLPTKGARPIASSPMIAEPPASRSATKPAPWLVTGYPFDICNAYDWLLICSGRRTLAPGVLIGADIVFWTDAFRFAVSIIAAQQYLPSLAKTNGRFRALWRPVFSGEGAERLTALLGRDLLPGRPGRPKKDGK